MFYSLEDVRIHIRLVRLLVEPPHLLDLLPRPRRQDADERLLEAKVLFVLVDDVLQTLGIEPKNEKLVTYDFADSRENGCKSGKKLFCLPKLHNDTSKRDN